MPGGAALQSGVPDANNTPEARATAHGLRFILEFHTIRTVTPEQHHMRALRVRRLRRWAIGIGLGLAAAVTLGWIMVASMLRAAPPWWRQVRVQEQKTQEIAQEVENALGTHLHLARDGEKKPDGIWRSEPWGVSIPSADANAWLNARLPRWLETAEAGIELPDQVAEVQVEFNDGRVSIGVAGTLEVVGAEAGENASDAGQGEGARRIVWASAVPRIDESGLLSLTLDRVYVGRLPISRSLLAEIAERAGLGRNGGGAGTGAGASPWLDLLRGHEVKVVPLMKLEDGRRVRITGLRAREGRLEVTCVTEHGGG